LTYDERSSLRKVQTLLQAQNRHGLEEKFDAPSVDDIASWLLPQQKAALELGFDSSTSDEGESQAQERMSEWEHQTEGIAPSSQEGLAATFASHLSKMDCTELHRSKLKKYETSKIDPAAALEASRVFHDLVEEWQTDTAKSSMLVDKISPSGPRSFVHMGKNSNPGKLAPNPKPPKP
jgi:hypothetical protein